MKVLLMFISVLISSNVFATAWEDTIVGVLQASGSIEVKCDGLKQTVSSIIANKSAPMLTAYNGPKGLHVLIPAGDVVLAFDIARGPKGSPPILNEDSLICFHNESYNP